MVQLPQKIFIFRSEKSRHSPALEFKLKNVSNIHSLNKTKQLFYNLSTFNSILESRTISERIQKKISKIQPWVMHDGYSGNSIWTQFIPFKKLRKLNNVL